MHKRDGKQSPNWTVSAPFRFLQALVLTILAVVTVSPEAVGQTSKEMLARGIAYYNNDDITDKAATQFRQILQREDKRSSEAENAQYYLASYYHRKFYIIKRNQGREDQANLLRAKKEYSNYTGTYYHIGSKKWLSDAFFNLALVYFELKDSQRASWELDKVCKYAWMDPEVYIYEVVWSPDAGDVIDAKHNSYALGDFVRKYQKEDVGHSFQDLVNIIKRWSRAEKSKK